MTLLVETPGTRAPERDYILGVVLGKFLGLSWRRDDKEERSVRITLPGRPGELRLPDRLFTTPDDEWLSLKSMPNQPIPRWNAKALGLSANVVSWDLPVIYGDSSPRSERADGSIWLPIDVFGSSFFMLSRYEEMITKDRDEHGRFPAWASLAYKEDFLERPIVDEYVEILWAAMQCLWSTLERKHHAAATFVTCDVDNPYSAYTKSAIATGRKIAGDVVKRKSLKQASQTLKNAVATRRGDYDHDPLDTFDWMMDVNEREGNIMAFYFLCDRTVAAFDGHYDLGEPRLRKLMRRIHERGHEIGVHGSYGTYRDAYQFATEVDVLRDAMKDEGIDSSRIGARQHYLRWNAAETPQWMERAGVTYDTTLSYADHPGFRCGTAKPYTWFNCLTREKLTLLERPLTLMECSMLSPKYDGAGYTDETLQRMTEYKKRCHDYGGEFVLLWHNSHFNHQADRTFYEFLISR